MSIISVKELLEAGVHFGHRVSRWNPKMAPFIFGKRNLIHIISLKETVKGLIKAYHFLSNISALGEEVIFIGTKRQAKSVVKREAQRCQMHFVSERWLGGTLTNFETIRKRLERLEELENMEKSGAMEALSKKMVSSLKREMRRIERNLEGVKKMLKLPGALVIVDPKKEYIALKEASRLGVPTICLIDTDSDPDLVDIRIPGNDDAMRSIEVICSKLADAIMEGKAKWEEKQSIERKGREEAKANAAASAALAFKGDEGEWDAAARSKKASQAPAKPRKPGDDVKDGRRDNRGRSRSGGGGSSGGPRRDRDDFRRFGDRKKEGGAGEAKPRVESKTDHKPEGPKA